MGCRLCWGCVLCHCCLNLPPPQGIPDSLTKINQKFLFARAAGLVLGCSCPQLKCVSCNRLRYSTVWFLIVNHLHLTHTGGAGGLLGSSAPPAGRHPQAASLGSAGRQRRERVLPAFSKANYLISQHSWGSTEKQVSSVSHTLSLALTRTHRAFVSAAVDLPFPGQ